MAMALPSAAREDNPLSRLWADLRSLWKSTQISLGMEAYPWDDLQWQPPWTTSMPYTPPCLSTIPATTDGDMGEQEKDRLSKSLRSFKTSIEQCETLQDIQIMCDKTPLRRGKDELRAKIVLSDLLCHSVRRISSSRDDWRTTFKALLLHCLQAFEGNLDEHDVTPLTKMLLNGLDTLSETQEVLPIWFSTLHTITVQGNTASGELELAALKAIRTETRLDFRVEWNLIPPQVLARVFAMFDHVALGRILILCATYHTSDGAKARTHTLELFQKLVSRASATSFHEVARALTKASTQEMKSRERRRLRSWLYVFTYEIQGETELLHLSRMLRDVSLDVTKGDNQMLRLLLILAKFDPQAAVRLFKNSNFRIHTVRAWDFISALMDHRRGVPTWDIMHVMRHVLTNSRVRDNELIRGVSMSPERVELIGSVALKFATRRFDRPRQAFRNVYHCYRLLKDHNVPVTKEVVQALCISGVVRTLQARHRLSTAKFAWIAGLVREIEGTDVAERLDKMAFSWRQRIRKDTIAGSHTIGVRVPRRRWGLRICNLNRRRWDKNVTWSKDEENQGDGNDKHVALKL